MTKTGRLRRAVPDEVWRAARNALISSRGAFTSAENSLFRNDALSEHDYHEALAEQDRTYEAIREARLAVYDTTPRSLRDVVAILTVMRGEEEDVFDDQDLARAMDAVIDFLQSLPSIGEPDGA